MLSDGFWRGTKLINLKEISDKAIQLCSESERYVRQCKSPRENLILCILSTAKIFYTSKSVRIQLFTLFVSSYIGRKLEIATCIVVKHLSATEEVSDANGISNGSGEPEVISEPAVRPCLHLKVTVRLSITHLLP